MSLSRLVSGLFLIVFRPDHLSPRRIGTARACDLSATVLLGCLKLTCAALPTKKQNWGQNYAKIQIWNHLCHSNKYIEIHPEVAREQPKAPI